jgi:hypothetical protein
MDAEKKMSEQESLRLIAATIQEAKGGYYHDSGIGAIFWGTVISIAGLMTFLTLHFKWENDFDWWLLALGALVPQLFISIWEGKHKVVKTHVGRALDIVWILFGCSIFAIIFYMNFSPEMYMKFLAEDGTVLIAKELATGETSDFQLLVAPSPGSLLLLLFAFPTMVTGVVQKFWPMVLGALITYVFFVISIYTRNPIDQLLMGISGLLNWLIPGLILRKRYLRAEKLQNV